MEEDATKAVALDPTLPLAHFLLGELYLYKSKVPEAIAELEKELALNPGHAPVYSNWPMPTRERRSSTKPNACFSAPSGSMPPPPAGPYILLGQAYRDVGNKEGAENEFKLAEQLNSNADARQ